ncbi:MAG: hypothetical protein J6W81_06175 [Lentisphaeria bacterium]|nr:hypothetical protein [Lentisphaeria bacterium]
MIPIQPIQIFHVYLYLWLVILIILWFREELRRRKNFGWSVVKKRLYFCDNCSLSFLARHDGENVTRCPRCNELCFIRKSKRM